MIICTFHVLKCVLCIDITIRHLCLVQKTVMSVDLECFKCRKKVMEVIGSINGITSIALNPSRNIVIVTGEADPVHIVNKLRKFYRSVYLVCVVPLNEDYSDWRALRPSKNRAMRILKSCAPSLGELVRSLVPGYEHVYKLLHIY